MKRITLLTGLLAVAATVAVAGTGSFAHHRSAANWGPPVTAAMVHPATNWGPPVTAAMVHAVAKPAPVYWVHPVTVHR
jgi:hypothetical protein